MLSYVCSPPPPFSMHQGIVTGMLEQNLMVHFRLNFNEKLPSPTLLYFFFCNFATFAKFLHSTYSQFSLTLQHVQFWPDKNNAYFSVVYMILTLKLIEKNKVIIYFYSFTSIPVESKKQNTFTLFKDYIYSCYIKSLSLIELR